jgi:ribonuclease HII
MMGKKSLPITLKPPQLPKRGAFEIELLTLGHRLAGVDEVGRGCLAGPVFGGACILDYNKVKQLSPQDLENLRDSKKLSRTVRQRMIHIIRSVALDIHVGVATVREIEALGIVPATTLAIRRALEKCAHPFDTLLVDGKSPLAGINVRQIPIVKGDDLCYAIAAASIVAKEARDQHMIEMAEEYPVYGFENHVGYGTELHRKMIDKHGICPLHRKNFAPIRDYFST